jgi:hypothetical protein
MKSDRLSRSPSKFPQQSSPKFQAVVGGAGEMRLKMRHQNPANFQAKMKSRDFYNYDSKPRFEFNSHPKISTEDFNNKLSSRKRHVKASDDTQGGESNLWERFFLKTSPSGFLDRSQRCLSPSPGRLQESFNSKRTVRPLEGEAPSTPTFKGKRILRNHNRESDPNMLTPEKNPQQKEEIFSGKGKKTFPWEAVKRYYENIEPNRLGKKFIDLSENRARMVEVKTI